MQSDNVSHFGLIHEFAKRGKNEKVSEWERERERENNTCGF